MAFELLFRGFIKPLRGLANECKGLAIDIPKPRARNNACLGGRPFTGMTGLPASALRMTLARFGWCKG